MSLFYSTSEVADLFKVNRVTIYRWVKDGTIRAYKIGKHIKIPTSEVERLWQEFGFTEMFSPDFLNSKESLRKK